MAAIKELGVERSYVGQSIVFGSDFQSEIDNHRAIGSALKVGLAHRVDLTAKITSVGSHLRSFCITSGAVELEALVRDYPPVIFAWVVDPGVGTNRKGLLIETENKAALIGPDNGLLLPAARVVGIEKIWELDRGLLKAPSFSIFDARDLFMKAAGYLAVGASPAEIAQASSEERIVPLFFQHNQVIREDGTGNVVLEHYCHDYLPDRTSLVLRRADGSESVIPFVSSFDGVKEGELGCLQGSIGGRLWLFRNKGNAAETLGIKINQLLDISLIRTALERAILEC